MVKLLYGNIVIPTVSRIAKMKNCVMECPWVQFDGPSYVLVVLIKNSSIRTKKLPVYWKAWKEFFHQENQFVYTEHKNIKKLIAFFFAKGNLDIIA